MPTSAERAPARGRVPAELQWLLSPARRSISTGSTACIRVQWARACPGRARTTASLSPPHRSPRNWQLAPHIPHVFGNGCVLAQVIKKIKRNRVVRVGTKLIVGSERKLADHLELFRCSYNFVLPHSALRFGRETRTPGMQAGLAAKLLRFRGVFTARLAAARFAIVRPGAVAYHEPIGRLRCTA